MPQEVLNWILGIATIVVTSLISLGFGLLTNWVNGKVKDKKAAKLLTDILLIIKDAVMEIYQTFVESLKKEGKFTTELQKEAKAAAIRIIKAKLTEDMYKYIQDNFGDIDSWISDKIEVTIFNCKNIMG